MWKWIVGLVVVGGLLTCLGAVGGGGWWYYQKLQAERAMIAAMEAEKAKVEAEAEAARAAEATRKEALENARSAASSNDPASSVGGYSTVLDAEPDNQEALLGRAKALAALDRFGEAETDLRRLVKLDPQNAQAWEVLAWVCSRAGQDEDAAQALDALLKLDPNNAKAWRDHANALFRTGNLATALDSASRSCDLGFTEGCALKDRLRSMRR